MVRRIRHTALLVRELLLYCAAHDSWWLLALLAGLLGATVLLATTQVAAPFIYTLF